MGRSADDQDDDQGSRSSLRCQVAGVLESNGLPPGIVTCVIGSGRTVGEALLHDRRLPLVSFTGSSEVRPKRNVLRRVEEP